MKKNDFYLIAILLLIGLLGIIGINFFKKEGTKVVVYVDNKEYKVFDLKEDIEYTIEQGSGISNTFVIKDGYVDMVDATCPDSICVKEKPIHYDHETIVCLPNKVVISIVGGEQNPIDKIVN